MKTARRSFLRSTATGLVPLAAARVAAEAAPSQGGSAAATTLRHSSFDPWVEVNPAHLRHNVAQVSRRVAGRPILAVIKNNGYGLGVANVGRILDGASELHGFAVVKLAEAVALRDAGVRKPILLMGPFDEADLEEAVARDITPMVYTPVGDLLDRVAAAPRPPGLGARLRGHRHRPGRGSPSTRRRLSSGIWPLAAP